MQTYLLLAVQAGLAAALAMLVAVSALVFSSQAEGVSVRGGDIGADGVLEATPTERQGSHMTGALGESDGFAVAPEEAGELPAGAAVDVLRLG